MTSTPFKAGFYTTSAPASSVAGDWRLGGWAARVLSLPDDLGRDARRTVLESLRVTLRLPSSTGATLDAFGEALGHVAEPTVLVWGRGSEFAEAHPAVWAKLSDVLVARAKEQPPFAVVLAGGERKGL